ncbi:peptidase domain-containing ABC transporter [Jiulongibacter sp. NS-SX5]|uniref:peptidase domain-containing ABC transporter n=1 Tax=Jiulongibacter sp. NS-SX5 TaxID=3463854 RepID=UPI004058C84F
MADKSHLDIGEALRKVLDILWLDKKDITAVYIYSIFAGLVSLSLPLGIQTIIGFVQAAQMSTSILLLIALVLLGTFIAGLLQVRQLQLIEKIEQKIFVRYSLEYAQRLPLLDIHKINQYYLPELVNRFFDAPSLQKSLHKLLVDVPYAIIQIVFGVILLSFYHPLFIAFGLVLLVIIILILRFTSYKGFATSLETSDYKYKSASWLEEMARGVKTFKYARHTTLHLSKMDSLLSKYLKARTSHFGVLKFQYWTLIFFKVIITAAMLILGVTLLVDQQINIGQFIASDIVIVLILGSVEKLVGNMDQVYEAMTSVVKLDKVARAEIESSGTMELSAKAEGVSVKMSDVTFGYNSTDVILDQLSFDVKPGEWLMVHGPSGSGKTSLLRLLTGSFRKRSGQILIDGLPISNYNNVSLRKQMGILLGKQNIFEGSILENITLGDENLSIEKVQKVCEITGLDKFISGRDEGMSTVLDPFGRKLSSVVTHQILLSRAILLQNRLTLMEEPFKHLTDEQIKGVVEYLKETKTTVILASANIDCAKWCDKVIQLNG